MPGKQSSRFRVDPWTRTKPVRNKYTKKVYPSMTEAAKQTGVPQTSISAQCAGLYIPIDESKWFELVKE